MNKVIVLAFSVITLSFLFSFSTYLVRETTAQATMTQIIESNSMSLDPNPNILRVQSDGAASGGSYLKFWRKVTSTTSFSTNSRVSKITIRASGDQCDGVPNLILNIDGSPLLSTPVSSLSWEDYSVNTNLDTGTHDLTISYPNDYYIDESSCDRNLKVDKITIYDETLASPSPVISPTPTVTPIPAPTLSPSPTPTPTPFPPPPGGSFTGQYFTNATLSGNPTLTRSDSSINFDWGFGSPDPIIPADNFSARWTSNPVFLASTYRFFVSSDDGVRLKIDGVTKIDKWIDQAVTTYTADVPLTAGNHVVILEFYDKTEEAVAKLSWTPLSSPSITPTPSPTPSAPNNFSPSGQSMPQGDLPGWHQVLADDFTTNVAVGNFPGTTYGTRWDVYKNCWHDTSNTAFYYPSKVISVSGGVLKKYLHSEYLNSQCGVTGSRALVAAITPKIPKGMISGKYTIRFKADQLHNYKIAWMLWPDSGNTPYDGEIDFPEGYLDSTFYGFTHHQNANVNNDQDAYSSGVTFANWHTASTEWVVTDRVNDIGTVKYVLDGKTIGTSTSRIPNTPMHWVLQTETCVHSTCQPDPATSGNLYIDWVVFYTKI